MNQHNHDGDIIDGLHKGDPNTIRYLYKLSYRSLCYFAEKLIHDKEEAEDIAVETFLKLLNKKEDFDNISDVLSFLYTAARNACFDFLRKEKRHSSSHAEIHYLSETFENAAEDQILSAKVLQAMYAEIENLPPQCRQVFKSLFIEGKNTSLIADEMGISSQTVLNQKSKAIKILRSALLKEGLLSAIFFMKYFFSSLHG